MHLFQINHLIKCKKFHQEIVLLKTFNSTFNIEVWFTGQNSKSLEIDDKKVINY